MRIIIMTTCFLSMVGAFLIILSFICCKDLRTRGRQILVHISIMDLGVATFNLFGAGFYFDQYYRKEPRVNCTFSDLDLFNPPHYGPWRYTDTIMCPKTLQIQYLCFAQACFSLYFTYGSILWTNSLCFYLYFRIVHCHARIARYCLYSSYIFCYGMPLLLTLWLAMTGRLGYSPYESSGWCSIILMHPMTKERDIFASVFGYNLWIVLTFVFVPILSFVVHINVRNEVSILPW